MRTDEDAATAAELVRVSAILGVAAALVLLLQRLP